VTPAGWLDVLLDVTVTAHSSGGVGRYVSRLARALRDAADGYDVRFRTLDVPAARPGTGGVPCRADLVLPDPFYLSVPLLRRIPLRRGTEPRSRAERLGRLAGGTGGVFHHGGVQPSCPDGWSSVITHFDPSGILHPEWHTRETVEFAARESAMVRGGSSVLAISGWAARQAESCFGLPEGSAGSAPGAADPLYTPGEPDPDVLSGFGLARDGYVLHVGGFVPRKNIPFLLDVYGDCVNCGFGLPLVLVGAEEWKLDASLADRPWARRLMVPEDKDLLHLYRGARAVVLPSRYEGLGFPALEAMACHVPLLCSSATALPETVGDGGLLLDPGDRDAWGRAILTLDDPGRVAVLAGMAASAPRRTWEEAARRAIEFYGRVAL
jgi:glycosyltransferase involved in cell wall biosynthesis